MTWWDRASSINQLRSDCSLILRIPRTKTTTSSAKICSSGSRNPKSLRVMTFSPPDSSKKKTVWQNVQNNSKKTKTKRSSNLRKSSTPRPASSFTPSYLSRKKSSQLLTSLSSRKRAYTKTSWFNASISRLNHKLAKNNWGKNWPVSEALKTRKIKYLFWIWLPR